MKPLSNLIRQRGFDRYQSGLRSRFAAYRFQYQLTYCELTDDAAMRLEFESALHLGRVTAWESGSCDLEVIEIHSGATVIQEHYQFTHEREFFDTYPRLILFMRDALGWPGGDQTYAQR